MKKAAVIFLVFLYGFSTTGIAVKGDYCCDKLKSVTLVLADNAKDKNGCCGVKYQSLKVNDVHAAAHIVSAPASWFILIDVLNNIYTIDIIAHQYQHSFVNVHAPPLITSTPVYISNCVFRI
jgi:hypothetical protein